MDPQPYFSALARYNVWATSRLFESVDTLSDDEYRRDMGLFFKSIHGTLNHLLVGEHLLWFPRFAQGISPKLQLDAEVEPDRAKLKQQIMDGVQRWQPLIESWSAGRFDGTLDYTTTQGAPLSLPFTTTLAHVFNHSTHHRGQITAALTMLGKPCPVLDLARMLQQENQTA